MMKKNKIYVIGPEGSGKSTLATFVSKKLKIKHYDLDDVVWSRRYDKKRTKENRIKKLVKIVEKKKWVLEGAFGGWTEPAFKNADLVVMLNLNYNILIRNLLKRCLIGRFKGYEKEKTGIKGTIHVIKHVKKYRFRDHPKSYSGHMKLIKKYKVDLVEIKSRRDLKRFLDEVE